MHTCTKNVIQTIAATMVVSDVQHLSRQDPRRCTGSRKGFCRTWCSTCLEKDWFEQ